VALFNAIGKSRAEREALAAENGDNGDDAKAGGTTSKSKNKKDRAQKLDKKSELLEKKKQVKNLSRDLFLNSVRSENKSVAKTPAGSSSTSVPLPRSNSAGEQRGKESKPEKWSALRDDFMTDKGTKLKVTLPKYSCRFYKKCFWCRIGIRTTLATTTYNPA
jgi:hypothetical protein